MPVRIDDDPKPWWLPEVISAVDYLLRGMDRPNVLEFGCGNSTVWLSNLAHVVSVEEEHPGWMKAVNKRLLQSKTHSMVVDVAPQPFRERYDFVILDGGDRVQHGIKYWPAVKMGGFMMLDDSERQFKYGKLFQFMALQTMRTYEFSNIWQREGPAKGKFRKTIIWQRVEEI